MKNHLFKLTLFVVLVLGIYLSPFKIIVVSGNSMYPTLKNKQILIGMEANKFDKEDVVVAYFEDNYIIKRVKFLEGDEYYYWLNNNSILPIIVDKNFYEHFDKSNKSQMVYKSKIEKNKIYLLGDNLNNSDDSRRFGCLDKSSIKYKIIFPRF